MARRQRQQRQEAAPAGGERQQKSTSDHEWQRKVERKLAIEPVYFHLARGKWLLSPQAPIADPAGDNESQCKAEQVTLFHSAHLASSFTLSRSLLEDCGVQMSKTRRLKLQKERQNRLTGQQQQHNGTVASTDSARNASLNDDSDVTESQQEVPAHKELTEEEKMMMALGLPVHFTANQKGASQTSDSSSDDDDVAEAEADTSHDTALCASQGSAHEAHPRKRHKKRSQLADAATTWSIIATPKDPRWQTFWAISYEQVVRRFLAHQQNPASGACDWVSAYRNAYWEKYKYFWTREWEKRHHGQNQPHSMRCSVSLMGGENLRDHVPPADGDEPDGWRGVEHSCRALGFQISTHRSKPSAANEAIAIQFTNHKSTSDVYIEAAPETNGSGSVVQPGSPCDESSQMGDVDADSEEVQHGVLAKYWMQRYRYFSKFDKGVLLDKESWYSITPEKIARHHARRMECRVIVDGFCGVGGNTIQFAQTCQRVIAIDIDPSKVRMARHNAKIYGVEEYIHFVAGDFFAVMQELSDYIEHGAVSTTVRGILDFIAPHTRGDLGVSSSEASMVQAGPVSAVDGEARSRAAVAAARRRIIDVVYLSPPWGGPEYLSQASFRIDSVVPSIRAMVAATRRVASDFALFLPRNTDLRDIRSLFHTTESFEVEENVLNRKVKSLTVYANDLVLKEV